MTSDAAPSSRLVGTTPHGVSTPPLQTSQPNTLPNPRKRATNSSAGRRGARPSAVSTQTDEVEHFIDSRPHRLCVEAAHLRTERDVAGDVSMGEQRVLLEHQPQPPAMGRDTGDVFPGEPHTPRV